MNILLLENFKKDINNIKEYIKHIELVSKIEQEYRNQTIENSIKEFIEHCPQFSREKKSFEHRAIIISLYGILENHINLWVQEHINNIPTILKYKNLLSNKMIESNFNLSIDLISNMLKQKNNPKYENISKEMIIKKLDSDKFELNSEAFISNSGNLTHQKIIELFSPLDININNNSTIREKKSTITTLVSLRNEISHGTNIDNIITEFNEYIDALLEYGEALFYILQKREDEYKIKYEIEYEYCKINKVYNVFDNKILTFELENNNISVGDFIIVKAGNNIDLFKGKILSIEVANKKKDDFSTDSKCDIGVEIETKEINIKNNQTFYIKKKSLS